MVVDVRLLSLALLALYLEHRVTTAASFLPDNFAFWISQSCELLILKLPPFYLNISPVALVVQNWLYIDGGEIWARWDGTGVSASHVWSKYSISSIYPGI